MKFSTTYQPKRLARGVPRPSGLIQTSIQWEPETFHSIRTVAKRENVTFSEAAKMLVEWGLESQNA